jgi:diacylglycerol kinase (ATP)
MTDAFVVGRHRKGKNNEEVVQQVQRALRAAGWTVDSRLVTKKKTLERAAKRAVDQGCDVVVAVGGDGAVVRVASALTESTAALGVIPTGTGNLLALNLGIPHDTRKATDVLLSGRVRRIDMGRLTADGTTIDFAVAAGVGFDADVIDETDAKQKLKWGKLAYLSNVLGQAGGIRNVEHEITLDGVTETMEAAQVFIANFGKMLPMVEPRRKIRPDDGYLDVIVVRASGPLPGLMASWEAIRQEDLGSSSGGRVFRARAREIRIETKPVRLVEADGSSVGRTPLVATIMPKALRVIVPRK